jgi:hypothetical protein
MKQREKSERTLIYTCDAFPPGRDEISIKEEIYGDQGENLRGSRKKFTGIKEEIYGDQGRNLRGSRKNFTGIEEENRRYRTKNNYQPI